MDSLTLDALRANLKALESRSKLGATQLLDVRLALIDLSHQTAHFDDMAAYASRAAEDDRLDHCLKGHLVVDGQIGRALNRLEIDGELLTSVERDLAPKCSWELSAKAQLCRGIAARFAEQLELALHNYSAAENLVDGDHPHAHLWRALLHNNKGVVYRELGLHGDALREQLAGLRDAQEAAHPPSVARVLANLSQLALDVEEYDSAIKYATDALRLASDPAVASRFVELVSAGNLALAHIDGAGDLDVAEALLARCEEIAQELVSPQELGRAIHNRGWLEYRRGAMDVAVFLIEASASLKRAGGPGNSASESLSYLDLTEVHLAAGSLEAAVESWARAMAANSGAAPDRRNEVRRLAKAQGVDLAGPA